MTCFLVRIVRCFALWFLLQYHTVAGITKPAPVQDEEESVPNVQTHGKMLRKLTKAKLSRLFFDGFFKVKFSGEYLTDAEA